MSQRVKDIKNLYTIESQYKNFINLIDKIHKKNMSCNITDIENYYGKIFNI